jgi:hypothetical protein
MFYAEYSGLVHFLTSVTGSQFYQYITLHWKFFLALIQYLDNEGTIEPLIETKETFGDIF